jgi:hypothetical protein
MAGLISQSNPSTARQESFYLKTPPDSTSSVSESSELESPSMIRTITNIWKAILSLSEDGGQGARETAHYKAEENETRDICEGG